MNCEQESSKEAQRAERTIFTLRADVNVQTVGIFLCPNRNLTTLTASILALHPNVQVLNHGFERLRELGVLDFLTSGEEVDLNRFVDAALEMSCGGKRGDFGGSILLSHAYDRSAMQALYRDRYGIAPLKSHITCLVWKDGARLLEFVRAAKIDVSALTERLPRLRFISPVRRAVLHLRSIRRYYAPGLPAYVSPSLANLSDGAIAKYIVDAHEEFADYLNQNQSKFFRFHEDEIGVSAADSIAVLLRLEQDARWREDVAKMFVYDGPDLGDSAPETDAILDALQARPDQFRRWALDRLAINGTFPPREMAGIDLAEDRSAR